MTNDELHEMYTLQENLRIIDDATKTARRRLQELKTKAKDLGHDYTLGSFILLVNRTDREILKGKLEVAKYFAGGLDSMRSIGIIHTIQIYAPTIHLIPNANIKVDDLFKLGIK